MYGTIDFKERQKSVGGLVWKTKIDPFPMICLGDFNDLLFMGKKVGI